MKSRFTDEEKYPRGYVRSESTDIRKTWAAARKRLALASRHAEGNVRMLRTYATTPNLLQPTAILDLQAKHFEKRTETNTRRFENEIR